MHVHQRPGGVRAGIESAAQRSAIAVVKGLAWPGGVHPVGPRALRFTMEEMGPFIRKSF